MEFFCRHRDRPDSLALREELREEHWSYMDGYDVRMIARGPTCAADGVTPGGSVHVLDLPGPGRRAGLRLRGTRPPGRRLPGRTAAPVARHAGPHHGRAPRRTGGRRPVPGPRARCIDHGSPADLEPPGRDDLIAYGPLLSDAGNAWLGTAALVRAPDARAARGLLTAERDAAVEVHRREAGGRR